jgi:hypothetical protein
MPYIKADKLNLADMGSKRHFIAWHPQLGHGLYYIKRNADSHCSGFFWPLKRDSYDVKPEEVSTILVQVDGTCAT